MYNYEKTIDLVHVINYIKYSLKKIIYVTMVVTVIAVLLLVGKNVVIPNDELYYSTTKILFKFNSWSTTEKQYNLEDWNLVGAENYKSDSNSAFISNSNNIFMSDKILLDVINEFGIEDELTALKKNIIVSRISGTDVLNFVVKAKTPELAEAMLNKIIEDGLKSIEGIYELKYEVIDSYTETDNLYNTIEIKGNGDIEASSNFMDNVKLVVLASGGAFALMIFYFGMKCILNNKVESVELVEEGFRTPVLQVLSIGDDDYDVTATKLINSGSKTVVFTSIKKEESIGKDIVYIAKKLIDRNKKTLIISVIRNDSNFVLDNSKITGVDVISINDESLLKKKINENEEIYDFILIETTCLDVSSDALLISKYVDYTVLVTVCDSVVIDLYGRKIQEFKKYSTGVDGVILKEVTKYSSSYKYTKII